MMKRTGEGIPTRGLRRHSSFSDQTAQPRDEMHVIQVKVCNQELHAISEYAAQCGETPSDLIRKCVIRHATLADGYGQLDLSYEFRMKMPDGCSASVQRQITQSNYNKIRKIMGMRQIQL